VGTDFLEGADLDPVLLFDVSELHLGCTLAQPGKGRFLLLDPFVRIFARGLHF